jgi:hypothetical protein
MTQSIRQFSKASLLAYIQDCHGLSPYDLEERDVNTKSKADVADAIECYGWAAECFEYCA